VENMKTEYSVKPVPLPVPMPTKASDDEDTVLFEARPDWIRLHATLFIGTMPLFLVGACILFMIAATTENRSDAASAALIGGGLLLVTIITPVAAWLSCLGTVLTITDKKTIWHHGVLSHLEIDLLHSHVRAVAIQQNFIQRMLGVGSVQISSAASGVAEITAHGFRETDKIKKIIQAHMKL